MTQQDRTLSPTGQPAPWREAVARGAVVVALVRHGRTRWNHERRFLGLTDLPLDLHGEHEARALARAVGRPFARVYSSPLARALQTARALHPEPSLVDELRELSHGELEGLRATEAMKRYPDFFARWAEDPCHTTVPGGESLGACRDRALAALTRLVSQHRPGEVLAVVSHQLVIAGLTCTFAGEDLRCWRDHGIGNARMSIASWLDGGWELVARNWGPDGDPPGAEPSERV